MKSRDALRALAEITAGQWGMVTTAQADMRGVSRLDLSRLTEQGHLLRLAHGLYADAGAPSHPLDDLRAAWLSTEPRRLGEERIRDRENGVVIAGASAARLHEIGDLWATRHDFVTRKRRQSQRTEIRYRQRSLDPVDVTLVAGLPVMTIERTIADLVDDFGDLSLVADALRDAALKRNLDLERLEGLLAPYAQRHALPRGDGRALLERLSEIAGIDADSVARQVAADAALAPRVAARILETLDLSAFRVAGEIVAQNVDAQRMKEFTESLAEYSSLSKHVSAAIGGVQIDPQLVAAVHQVMSDKRLVTALRKSMDRAADE